METLAFVLILKNKLNWSYYVRLIHLRAVLAWIGASLITSSQYDDNI